MNCRHVLYWLLLALSAGLTLLSILPVADAPVVVYDGAVFIVPLCVFGACLCAWGSLLASSKKRLDCPCWRFGSSAGICGTWRRAMPTTSPAEVPYKISVAGI